MNNSVLSSTIDAGENAEGPIVSLGTGRSLKIDAHAVRKFSYKVKKVQ